MITILTATYNRASTIDRLYASLLKQTDSDFEWVIIDDGSNDNTRDIVQQYIMSQRFLIKYRFQENAGKHAAINSGCTMACGEYIFIVDSDDALEPNAIATIKIAVKNNPGFVGYCFRKKTFDGLFLGNILSYEKTVMTPTEAAHVFMGDLAYVFLKVCMLENSFPIIVGEKFVPELYVWNLIADAGEIIFFPNEWIYLCEYLPDGYSMNFKSNLRRNPKGFLLFYKDQFMRESSFISKAKAIVRIIQCMIYRMIRK